MTEISTMKNDVSVMPNSFYKFNIGDKVIFTQQISSGITIPICGMVVARSCRHPSLGKPYRTKMERFYNVKIDGEEHDYIFYENELQDSACDHNLYELF